LLLQHWLHWLQHWLQTVKITVLPQHLFSNCKTLQAAQSPRNCYCHHHRRKRNSHRHSRHRNHRCVHSAAAIGLFD